MKKLTFDEELKEQLKDPEFKKAWDELETEYELINALIAARVYRNMTQKELSQKSGIDQANISKIETGMYNPSLKILKRLADAMDMKLKIEFVPDLKQ